eukprot:TRINITY_DN939_c2_g1_i3.p1 TRINITY_DN939_c2_g1~~TRINITY_DN939_c2_g1_i3.p1  ORF type:complete len:230 (-),score=33.81 TRINITY_DN939_c2_g1_i3:383-1072(-)
MSKLAFALLRNSLLVCASAVIGDIGCQAINKMNEDKSNKINANSITPNSNSTIHKNDLTTNKSEGNMTLPEFYEKAMSGHKFYGWWDVKRTAVMGINGFFVIAPISYGMNQKLEKLFPGKEVKQIMKKMVTMWCIVPFTISLSFISVGFLNGRSIEQAENKIKADLLTTMGMGAAYWPIINFMNFRLVPVDYRPVAGSIAASVWQMYMSNQVNKPVEPSKQENLAVERL